MATCKHRRYPNNLLRIVLLLLLGLPSSIHAQETALEGFLRQHPVLLQGGATAATFAAWANSRYLLGDASAIGPVASLGEGVQGYLFVAGGEAIVAFWTGSPDVASAHVAVLPHAKLYSRGARTRVLSNTPAMVPVEGIPIFVRNAAPIYLQEAVRAEIAATMSPLIDALRAFHGNESANEWQAVVSIADEVTTPSALLECLTRQQQAVDALLSSIIQLPNSVDARARFALAARLVAWRLRLTDMRDGSRQFISRPGDTASPFSPIEFSAMQDEFLQWLSLAEPRTALRGRPESGLLLRRALRGLQRIEGKGAPREQEQLTFLYNALPYLLAIEPASVQNLTVTPRVTREETGRTLRLSVRNDSAELAEGWLEIPGFGETMRWQFTIPAGESGEFPPVMIDAAVAVPAPSLFIFGALTDGTPVPQVPVPVHFTE